ncbi:hypothetical protein PR048_014669, partial [Dryococelus australis]
MGSDFTADENGDDVTWNDILLGDVEEVVPCQRISHSLLPTLQGHASLLKIGIFLSFCCDGIIPSVYHEFQQSLPTVQAKRSNIPNENTFECESE